MFFLPVFCICFVHSIKNIVFYQSNLDCWRYFLLFCQSYFCYIYLGMKCFIPTRPAIPGIKSHHHTSKRRKCKQKGTDIFISQTIFCIVERTLIVHCHIKYAEKYYDAENQPVAVMERCPALPRTGLRPRYNFACCFICRLCRSPRSAADVLR